MPEGPLPYVELLLYVAGTFLYGFLVRELVRRPDVVPGNWPLRLAAGVLLLWFSGTLLDQWLVVLLGPLPRISALGAWLDVARGVGWLLAPPLLLHALARLHAPVGGRPSAWVRIAVAASYGGLGLFAAPAMDYLVAQSPYLIHATERFYPRLVAHCALGMLPAAWLAAELARRTPRHGPAARLGRFLGALSRLLVGLVGLLALGFLADPWSVQPSFIGGLLRTAVLSTLLLPGALFVFYVQRYNLLRLSLSNRSMRRVGAVLLVVVLAMLVGPALGAGEPGASHRLLAWGLLAALAWAVLGRFLVEPWLDRSPALRAFLGYTVTPRELDRLMTGLLSLEGDRQALLDSTGDAVARWLGCEASFLPRTLATEALWRLLDGSSLEVAHRLDRLPSGLAAELDRHDLHAVFTLRVAEELVGVLGLAASATGGAHADGEVEAVRLVVRQLAASLALRTVAERRLADERLAGEQERLSMLGLVSASLAHEIKNPLSSMKVLAQTLREDLALQDPGGEGVGDLDVIVDQIDRLDTTAREILGFARARPGGVTDLSALVTSAVYILRAEARKRAISLTLDRPPEGLDEVPGSPAAWQTVVFNLLRNAVDHAPAEGVVRASLGRGPGTVRFEVSNPGALDDGMRDRLFVPFAGADPKGTGLGLALVARRLDELGADIEVLEAEGRVRFIVEAPAGPDFEGSQEAAPEDPAPAEERSER